MSNVQSISGRPVAAAGHVNADLVDQLEGFLARAKAGQIAAMAWVTIDANSGHECGWSVVPDGATIARGILALSYSYGKAVSE